MRGLLKKSGESFMTYGTYIQDLLTLVPREGRIIIGVTKFMRLTYCYISKVNLRIMIHLAMNYLLNTYMFL